MTKEDLIPPLQHWDGTHMEYLTDLYEQYHHDPTFFLSLLEITEENSSLQTATTWLIKHQYDQKQSLPQEIIDQLLTTSMQLDHWEAKLHILQLLPKVTIAQNTLNTVDQFVRKCLKDDTKFVRAWAYQGLYEVYKHIPEYEHELRLLCENALQTESAAIKARVRKVLAALDKRK